MTLAGGRCIGSIMHNVCLRNEGSMGLATDNMLGPTSVTESVGLLVSFQILFKGHVPERSALIRSVYMCRNPPRLGWYT